jgi:hypothetical protein
MQRLTLVPVPLFWTKPQLRRSTLVLLHLAPDVVSLQ